MKKSEMLRAIKQAGYQLVRHGRKHDLYASGPDHLIVSHGLNISPRTIKAVKLLLKRKLGKHTANATK